MQTHATNVGKEDSTRTHDKGAKTWTRDTDIDTTRTVRHETRTVRHETRHETRHEIQHEDTTQTRPTTDKTHDMTQRHERDENDMKTRIRHALEKEARIYAYNTRHQQRTKGDTTRGHRARHADMRIRHINMTRSEDTKRRTTRSKSNETYVGTLADALGILCRQKRRASFL